MACSYRRIQPKPEVSLTTPNDKIILRPKREWLSSNLLCSHRRQTDAGRAWRLLPGQHHPEHTHRAQGQLQHVLLLSCCGSLPADTRLQFSEGFLKVPQAPVTFVLPGRDSPSDGCY